MESWIQHLYSDPEMIRMGHHQRTADNNLGMGWIYYGLARTIRPHTVVAIGSWRGFAPMVIAKGLQDNLEPGKVLFIDPSMADDFWKDEIRVQEHFQAHGLANITHYLMTTQEFTATPEYKDLKDIGLLFVDGFHDREHARFDFEAFRQKLAPHAYVVFHDSVRPFRTYMYGADKTYVHDVHLFVDELKADPGFQVLDFPFASGMTIVREKRDPNDDSYHPVLRVSFPEST